MTANQQFYVTAVPPAETLQGVSGNSVASRLYGVFKLRASVVECASPLALYHRETGRAKRRRAAALQNLAELQNRFHKRLRF